MSFWRKTSRGYCDEDDVDGVFNVLQKRLQADPTAESWPYYAGALMVVSIMRAQDDIRDQSVFMQIFDRELEIAGIKPIEAIEKGE